MVLEHEPLVGGAQGLVADGRVEAEDAVGGGQLLLFRDPAGGEVRRREALHLLQFAGGKAQHRADVLQDRPLRRVDEPVGPRGLELDLQETAEEVPPAPDHPEELAEGGVEMEVRGLALGEDPGGEAAVPGVEPQPLHHRVGELRFLRAHPAVRLGDDTRKSTTASCPAPPRQTSTISRPWPGYSARHRVTVAAMVE